MMENKEVLNSLEVRDVLIELLENLEKNKSEKKKTNKWVRSLCFLKKWLNAWPEVEFGESLSLRYNVICSKIKATLEGVRRQSLDITLCLGGDLWWASVMTYDEFGNSRYIHEVLELYEYSSLDGAGMKWLTSALAQNKNKRKSENDYFF